MRTLPLPLILLAIVAGCSHSAQPDGSAGPAYKDQSPITSADKAPPFNYFKSPLKLGDVGWPYSFEVATVIDDSRAICKMRFQKGETVNAASERVWAFVPTKGLVTGHGYRFDKAGVADFDKLKEADMQVFKVVGTANYGGDTLFVVKPVR
jgi:hypothetical protein